MGAETWVLFALIVSGCAHGEPLGPGDRLGRGDDTVPVDPNSVNPCDVRLPIVAAGAPAGSVDAEGGLVRDRLLPPAESVQRNDELVIETKGLATNQSGWSFDIPLVGYNQYGSCKVCVYLALEGGRRLMASEGWVRNLDYEIGARLAGTLETILFREINPAGEFVPSGCQLSLAAATYSFDVRLN